MRLALGAALAAAGAFILFFAVSSHGGEAKAAPWVQVASLSQRRSYIASAQVGDRIFAAGGMVGETGRPLAAFTRYDAKRDEWTVLPQLPVPTRAAAAAGVGGTLYVIGGTTPTGNTAAVRAWDGRSWTSRAPLPSARFNHSAIAVGKEIYVLGGFREGQELRDVLVYDTVRDAWRRSTPLPRAKHAFDVVLFHDELWVIGGRRGQQVLREVEILNPATGRWRQGPAMPRPMELLGAAVVGEEIHAVWESTYQIYDARTGTWRQGPKPGVTRHALQTFYVDRALYTVGGCTTALRDSPIVERRALG